MERKTTMIGDRELIEKYLTPYNGPKNPNIYIALPPHGGLWMSDVYPWELVSPWTVNALN